MENPGYEPQKEICYASLDFPAKKDKMESATEMTSGFRKSLRKSPVHRFTRDQTVQANLQRWKWYLKQAGISAGFIFVFLFNILVWVLVVRLKPSADKYCS